MDRSVVPLSDSILNLISPSKDFEPFVPVSHQNLFRVLHLFDRMASGTQKVLAREAARRAQESSLLKQISSAPLPSKRPRSSSAPLFRGAPQKRSAGLNPAHSKKPTDKNLVLALEKIRSESSFQRRTPGIYQPIISPAADETPEVHIPRQFDGAPLG